MREALSEAVRIQEAYDSLVIQKKAVEAERDELEEARNRGSTLTSEDKKALEAEIRRLTDQIESAQDDSEQALAKMRRSQMMVGLNQFLGYAKFLMHDSFC
jgi:hypothetical protein